MTGIDFILGMAASLLAAAVDRVLIEQPGQWQRRRIDRRIDSMTDAIMQPMVEYFEKEKIDEETTKRIASEAEKPVRLLIESSDEMISRGLNAEAVVAHILEEMLDAPAREAAEENPAAFDTMLRAYVDLAVRTPPLFADWEQKQFAATFQKLEELEEYLARMYGDMRKVAERHERGEALVDRIIVHQAGRLALKMNMHGLRSSELPQTDINNLFILPDFSETRIDDDHKEVVQLDQAELQDYFSPSKTGLRCIVVASAGAGKTTWIEWLGARLLEGPGVSSLPVNIRLRQAMRAERLPTLIDAVRSVISPAFHEKFGAQDVETWAREGKLHFLLDGFDEVPERQRDRVWDWIQSIAAADPSLNIILTTRPLTTPHVQAAEASGYRNLALDPFTEDQVKAYISKYQEFGPPIQTGAPKLSPSELASAWGNDPSLGPLTANPLLLSTLLAVHHMDGELPQGRSALYERYVDGMLGAWESRKELVSPDVELTKQTKRKILESLAINMIANEVDAVDENEAASWIAPTLSENGIDVPVRNVLEHLRERSGLLIGPGQYSFAHKSIGEFLVACACNDGIARDAKGQRFDRMLLARRCSEDRWLMAVFLWAGLASVADVQIYIEDLMNSDNLGLADGLLFELGDRLDPQRREQIVWRFVERLNAIQLSNVDTTPDRFRELHYIPIPLANAVVGGMRTVEPSQRRPGASHFGEQSLTRALRHGWINAVDWERHLERLSPGSFALLSGRIGLDRKIAESTVPQVSVDEQIAWLTYSNISSSYRRSDQTMPPVDNAALEPYPKGIVYGVAMFAAWHYERSDYLNPSSEIAALEKLFEAIWRPEHSNLTHAACVDLCNLPFEGSTSWHEKISQFIESDGERQSDQDPLRNLLLRIDAKCREIKLKEKAANST